jgi:hypothetical protein
MPVVRRAGLAEDAAGAPPVNPFDHPVAFIAAAVGLAVWLVYWWIEAFNAPSDYHQVAYA